MAVFENCSIDFPHPEKPPEDTQEWTRSKDMRTLDIITCLFPKVIRDMGNE